MEAQPDHQLAATVLPAPLYRALVHIFAQGISDCMVVGGTALSGYYAGHRRSDDLDLFVESEVAHRAVVMAIRSLEDLGAMLTVQQSTAQFYSATCTLDAHDFTAQVVLDTPLFTTGRAVRAADGVHVANLRTLLKQKAATLVSRCSEKDLYDLRWLCSRFPEVDPADLVALGAEIDGGMTAEAALISLASTRLDPAACGFSRSQSAETVFTEVSSLKRALAAAFDLVARQQPAPAIGTLIRTLRR